MRRVSRKPQWRRWVASVVIGTQLTALVHAADHVPDLNWARAQAETIRNNSGDFASRSNGLGSFPQMTPAELSQTYQQGHTPEAHAAANNQRIADCRRAELANFPGMSSQQRTECQSVLAAAQITQTPNPYLDPTKPISRTLQRESDAAHLRGKEVVQSGAVAAPTSLSSRVECQTAGVELPPISREDVCPIDKPSEGKTCEIPASVQVVDGRVELTDNLEACRAFAREPYCERGDDECLETAQVNVGTGDEPRFVSVCVKKRRGYTCWQPNEPWIVPWTCSRLASDPNCRFTGESPLYGVSGQIVLAQRHFQCAFTPPRTVQTGSNCSTQVCFGETCITHDAQTNPDFANAIVGMEVLRQGGVYACDRSSPHCVNEGQPPEAQNFRLFSGIQDTCHDPVFGRNCCSSSDGAPLQSNRSILPSIGWQVAGSVVSMGAQSASNYMYDFMFTHGNEWMTEKAWQALSSGAWDPGKGFDLSLSLYGFSLSSSTGAGFISTQLTNFFGAESIVGKGLNLLGSGGSIELATNVFGVQGLNFSFNPYMLALQIAIQVIMEMMSCTPDEKMLAMRRGGNLCVQLNRYCSRRIPIIRLCIEYAEDWCCWNSRLAKLISTVGAAQLGSGPRCNGFSPEELARINFSAIDFSSFATEIMGALKMPDGTYMTSTMMQGSVRQQDAKNAVDPSRISGQVTDPNLVDYTAGRIRNMMRP